ncbi:MAG TPA: hypothetical protein VL485_20020 [Ktedonobacteraceae bacterium]|nr:hypothetical protein [Ktedonobacteraceae bacterium]
MSESEHHLATSADPKAIRQRVRTIVQSLNRMRRSEAYWHVGSVVGEVRRVLEQAWELLRADDGQQAILVLDAITKAYLSTWEQLDDSDGEASDFFQHLAPAWTEAMLSVEMPSKERKRWAKRFEEWQEEVGAYGVDEAFQAPQEAALVGWDDPALQRVLQRINTDEQEAEDDDPSYYADMLTTARLNILERRKQFEAYLALAKAEEHTARYVSMLVHLGRVDEALSHAQEYIATTEEVLAFATALEAHGAHAESLMVAEKGLRLPGDQLALALWLRDHAASLGETSLALRVAEIIFREEMSVDNYRKVAKYAGEHWPEYRATLLDYVRKKAAYRSAQAVRIFLYEKLLDEAVAALDPHESHTVVEKVVDAALQEQQALPWVIQACREQAEYLMNGAKAQYYYAVRGWLAKARQAYYALGREAEWRSYLNELLQTHRLKHKLVPLLKDLR